MLRKKHPEQPRTARPKERGRPIFLTIFSYMMVVLIIESILLVVGMAVTNVSGRLDQNARDILSMQVHNRASYLQDTMQKAQELTDLSNHIDATLQSMLEDGTLTLDDLNSNCEGSDALLVAIAPELVNTLRAKPVSGIFVMLNTKDLREREVGDGLAGIYLRDLDPDARPSDTNSDLMIERGSASVVKKLGITTDKSWQPVLHYQGLTGNGFFKAPFQTAYEDGAKLDAEDYGRWTTSVYRLVDDSRTAIAYSMPLILPDGTVYGVLGVELLTSVLQEHLPYSELQENNVGTYFLVSTTSSLDDDTLKVTKTVTSSEDLYALEGPAATMDCVRDGSRGYTLSMHFESYFAALEPLSFYNRNAPFSNEQWILIGTVRTRNLFAFSTNVKDMIALAMVVTLVLGVVCSFLVALTVARPTEKLYKEVISAQEAKRSPSLPHTGIRELDRFAEAFTSLNQELLNNSTKFLRIMDMASVELGGYELRYDTGSVFVTKNFFPLLGAPQIDGSYLSVRSFETAMRHIQLNNPCTTTAEGDKLLTIRRNGTTRYIMLRVTAETNSQIGLAEDVTAATLERMRIEHERDYDILTGLYNRQAFQRVCDELFQKPDQLGVAALLMMDLDNLKHINDTYGHDWGDQYIHRTGRCLAENTPTGTIVSRLSGDEFMLLFYGYPDREQIRARISTLCSAMQKSVALLPSGSELHISISGGISWYPDDGTDMETLKKYADFALYQVKRTSKGRLEEFDLEVYKQEAQAAQLRRDFQQLLTEERVYYVFQPIFSARSGKVLAYEALMRSDIPSLRSPATIMKMAREQGALYEIERLTFFKSLETFNDLRNEGLAHKDAMLFINSIASVCLRQEDSEYMDSRWHELRRQMVIEITEEEEMNREALEVKRHAPGFSGMFALDDYGSGYSNEGSLLELAPRFIKVDIAIIRGIDTDTDKQQILQNIVSYAHPRSMLIIAEGVENAAEMNTVIRLGADALQGYYLAKPAAIPAPISPAARQVIADCRPAQDEH